MIHAATDTSLLFNKAHNLLMFDTILQGTRHTLEFAQICGAEKFLLVSSGAVYGKPANHTTHIREDHPCQPIGGPTISPYAIGKYQAENMACLFADKSGLQVKIARCFAFVGPYLPLNLHYAIGNFIRDALLGNEITVQGDGNDYRSYLYATDLAIWLWTILFRGQSQRPYNVGSNQAYSIRQIAEMVADAFYPKPTVKIMKDSPTTAHANYYVPEIIRVKKELDLVPVVCLNEAIQLTKQFHLERTIP